MVTVSSGRSAGSVPARILAVVALCISALLIAPNIAFAQPTTPPEPPSTTYGFDQACNDVHDTLDGVGIPGLPSLGDLSSAICKGGNAATHPGEAVEAVKDKAWDSTFGKVVDSLLNGLGEAVIMSLVWWTKVPNEKITEGGTLFAQINDYTYQAQIILLVASVILSGARLAEARRGAAMSEANESFKMYARVVFSSWMLAAVVVAGTQVSDRFSAWLIDDATNGNAKGIAELMVKTSAYQAFSPGLVLIIALVGMLGAIAQAIFSVVRQGLLVVAAGFMPMAAAASGMKTGQQSYQKLTGWVIAFLLWKPVAAVVYMIAFTTANVGTDDVPATSIPNADQAQRMLVGLVLLCSVAFVLPALMRLVAPAVAIVGSGGSGFTATGAAVVGGLALASGGRALGIRASAAPGSQGYVNPGGGGGPRPTGAGGGTSPRPGPFGGGGGGGGGGRAPAPAAAAGGGGGGGGAAAVPRGAQSGGSARVPGMAMFAGNVSNGADRAAGNLAGDTWGNRAPDLGRSTIPR